MRAIAPHVEKLKEKHKDNKQEQARKTMELYKEHGINPFSGCLLVLIQLPIIFALYFVFFKGLPNFKEYRLKLVTTYSYDEIITILDKVEKQYGALEVA